MSARHHRVSLRTCWLTEDRGRDLLVVGPSLGTGVQLLWQACADLIAEQTGMDVLGWDLPGHGGAAPADGPFSLAELASGVGAAASDAAPDRPWAYAGVSVGGAVGLHLALAGLPQAVTVICSGARLGTAQGWAERAATIRTHGTSSLVEGSRQRWFAPGAQQHAPQMIDHLLESLIRTDAESYALVCAALGDHDLRAALPKIEVPVLVLGGAHDTVATPEVQRDTAQAIGGSHLVMLPNVAHLAPAEDAEGTADALSSWLRPER